MNYWLFKTEPQAFSIDDLKSRGVLGEPWDGVRNYQARNFLRDEIKIGDKVFIYHSSCKDVGIVGVAEVIKGGYVDATQFDPEHRYFDPKSTSDKPRWYCVDISYVEKFKNTLTLKAIKMLPDIQHIALVKKGARLSVMPVNANEWETLFRAAIHC